VIGFSGPEYKNAKNLTEASLKPAMEMAHLIELASGLEDS